MRVMAQVAMVMNLDKCIGCHTCSVTCKQTWTNRTGVEYAWFNNVETKPGVGYPRRYEDQEQWKGGWMLDKRGRLVLRSGCVCATGEVPGRAHVSRPRAAHGAFPPPRHSTPAAGPPGPIGLTREGDES